MTTNKYRFSIFTATYNRGSLLNRLYECIKNQDFLGNFEWVLVSDGSTDNTDDIVDNFLKEKKLHINYIKIPHGGKHMAWRAATDAFQGKYIITADDDDPLPPNMLSIYDHYWKELELSTDYESFWEVKSRAQYENGKLVGEPLPSPYFDSDYIEITYIIGKGAEMDGCRKVEVLRKEAAIPDNFWFEDKCTNFPEGVRWTMAARKYKTRFVPEITRTYVIGHESLCTSVSKSRSVQRNYNSLVSSLYSINEISDILIRYRFKIYIKLSLQLAYSAVRLNERIFHKISRIRDKLTYSIFYIPALIISKFRGY